MFHHSASSERRNHKRFLVQGRVRLRSCGGSSAEQSLELLNVSGGGILIFSKDPPALGTEMEAIFAVERYPAEFRVKVRCVRVEGAALALAFLETPAGIDDLLGWLEAESLAALL